MWLDKKLVIIHVFSYISIQKKNKNKKSPKGAKVYPASRRRSNKKGGAQRTAGSLLCAMIKKFYHGIQKAVHQLRFKNVEQHLLLASDRPNLAKSERAEKWS